MKVLIRTNDPVLISIACNLLEQEGLNPFVLDEHMSVLDGSIGVLPRRIGIVDSEFHMAKSVLRDAGLEEELAREGGGWFGG